MNFQFLNTTIAKMSKTSKKNFQSPRGMKDILPEDMPFWNRVVKAVEKVALSHGFSKIETPILESKDLFTRGTGIASEIVKKQMFSVKAKGGDSLVLRPEVTPSIVRAYIQHGMNSLIQPVKLFYYGPVFRYERPQQGRERQFHQFGFEVIGNDSPCYDAMIISMFYNILKELKIKKLTVKINSIGCKKCRKSYINALKKYYKPRLSMVCSDCKKRYSENPLRMLDCKNPKCQKVKSGAPNILDYLCPDCKKHFKEVLECLEALEVNYIIDLHLVRGLDYYSNTVFEIFPYDVESKESKEQEKTIALVGGGRYNYLVQDLGGKKTPAVGGAGGFERIIDVLKSQEIKSLKKTDSNLIFIIQIGFSAKKRAAQIFEKLAKEGFYVKEALGRDSLKAQLRIADKEKARIALIIGQKEVFDNVVILKDLESGAQEEVSLEDLSLRIKKRLK